jgi:hypothetical protein
MNISALTSARFRLISHGLRLAEVLANAAPPRAVRAIDMSEAAARVGCAYRGLAVCGSTSRGANLE